MAGQIGYLTSTVAPAATPNPLQVRVELHRHTQLAPLIPYAVDSVAFWSIDPRSVPFTPLEHRPHNLIAIGGGRGEERRGEKRSCRCLDPISLAGRATPFNFAPYRLFWPRLVTAWTVGPTLRYRRCTCWRTSRVSVSGGASGVQRSVSIVSVLLCVCLAQMGYGL